MKFAFLNGLIRYRFCLMSTRYPLRIGTVSGARVFATGWSAQLLDNMLGSIINVFEDCKDTTVRQIKKRRRVTGREKRQKVKGREKDDKENVVSAYPPFTNDLANSCLYTYRESMCKVMPATREMQQANRAKSERLMGIKEKAAQIAGLHELLNEAGLFTFQHMDTCERAIRACKEDLGYTNLRELCEADPMNGRRFVEKLKLEQGSSWAKKVEEKVKQLTPGPFLVLQNLDSSIGYCRNLLKGGVEITTEM